MNLKRFSKPVLIAAISIFGLGLVALAGSLTPPGAVSSTMNSLADLYASIAGTFDSSAIVANQNGSLIQNLKYIEANMSSGGGVSSNSLDFDELVNSMNLDATTTVASHGFSLDLTSTNVETGGVASFSNAFISDPSGTGNGKLTVLKTMSGSSTTSNFLKLTGTMPSTNTATSQAVLMSFSGAGSSSVVRYNATHIILGTGYTGTAESNGMFLENFTLAPVGTTMSALNAGAQGAVPGNQVGVSGFASGGVGKVIGGLFQSIPGGAATDAYGLESTLWSVTPTNAVAGHFICNNQLNYSGRAVLVTDINGCGNSIDGFVVQNTASSKYLVVNNGGNVAIGTSAAKNRLLVVDTTAENGGASASFAIRANSVTTGAIASISGTALTGGSVFRITVPASTSANNPHGLMLVQNVSGTTIASWSMGGALSIAGAIRSDGAVSNCTGTNTPSSGCIDYAESYPTTDLSLQPGELVSIDPTNSQHVIRAVSDPIGIVSTNPAALIDSNGLKTGSLAKSSVGTVPIALAGRVPVRITGHVSVGDHLALSGIPGTAQTATTAGMTIGIALENSDGPTVMTFVNTGYWAPGVVMSASTSSPGFDIGSVITAIIEQFKNLVLQVRGLIVQTIETQEGVTTYDKQTGEPYCMVVSGGSVVAQAGKCGVVATPTPEITPTPDVPTTDPTPSVEPTEPPPTP